MNAIEVRDVSKSYNGVEAVHDLSFTVHTGEIFGLLGPNGAGKTTTIRMLVDIIKPDHGHIRLFGQPLSEKVLDRVGYLPEERGLYRNQRVLDTLCYLARLKGADRRMARQRAESLLERVALGNMGRKKLNELSKGMQQKVQFVAAIVHDPDLIIVDEPFQGLDPINTELIKEILVELKSQGKTVLMSTHMMSQVEALCDRILLINRGRAVLYGELDEIKRQYAGNAVRLEVEGALDGLVGVDHIQEEGRAVRLLLAEGTTPQDILRQLVLRGVVVKRFEIATPPLDEIFIAAVEGRYHAAGTQANNQPTMA